MFVGGVAVAYYTIPHAPAGVVIVLNSELGVLTVLAGLAACVILGVYFLW